MLELRGLTYRAQGQPLIDALDLTLGRDGVTVIMGPNGAGKSLLLRLIHGLMPPTEGEILWEGAPPAPDVRRRQALVFQRPVLLRRSVTANVAFVSADPDRFLNRVGLLDKARRPARKLSGGEQQRLALARALATEPDVLMLDEPTASLDPAATQAIETIVAEEAAQGTRVLFVTHDVGQARRLASDVVFLAQGRVVEQAPALTFFNAPKSAEARAFLAGELVV